MLDALVQENVQVPISAIQAVAPSFPAQAAILMARLPASESRGTLNYWTSGMVGGGWSAVRLARVASMMLAKQARSSAAGAGVDPDLSAFVARVVAASENQLQITIAAGGFGSGFGGSTACGDGGGGPPMPGWPEVYFYGLEEHADEQGKGIEDANTSLVVDVDGDRIISKRWKESDGRGGPCMLAVEPLDASTRHRLIAYWLGVHDRDMQWHPVDSAVIVWTNESEYKRQLGTVIELQRRKLRETVAQLHRRGFLTDDTDRALTPLLVVTIRCDMDPCPLSDVP
jgi:hypothetical protein